ENKYDLILCTASLRHLTEEQGRQVIANMCRSAGDVILSPDVLAEAGHDGRLPVSWWIARFEEHGFRFDVEATIDAVTGQTMRFRAGPPTGALVDVLLAQRHDLSAQLAALQRDVSERLAAAADVPVAAADLRAVVADLRAEVAALRQYGDDKDTLIAG